MPGNREMTNRKNADAKKVAILVAGMHRSGTSAITRILSILGCALPKTLLAPHPSNERGFWESPEIVDVNREILVSAGSTLEEWRADEWREFDPRWYTSPVADELRRRARTALEREFGDSPLFVIKDPRLCRLLPFWIEVLESFDARPLVVSPIRNPLDVAESLETRDGIDRAIGHLMWLQHVLSAETDSRDLGRAYFRYDRLLSEPHAVVDRLGDVLGVSWPRRMNDTDEEIDHFLSTRLRHHSNDDTRVMENPRLSHWLRSSFEIFARWTNGKERKTDTARLDRIKAAFDDAMPAFDRAVSVGLKTTRRLSTAQAELAERGGQITSLKGSLAERHDEVMVLHAKVEDQNRTLAERHDEVMVLHAKVEDQNRTLAERHDEVMVLHAKVEDQNRTLAERHDEVMVLHAKVEDQNRTLAERHDEVMVLHAKVEDQNRTLAERHDEVMVLHAKVEDQNRTLAERHDEVMVLHAKVEDQNRTLAERHDEVMVLHAKVEDQNRTLAERHDEVMVLHAKVEDQNRTLAERHDEVMVLHAKVEDQNRTLAERHDEVMVLHAKVEDQNRTLAERHDEVMALLGKVEEIWASSSWRLTRPLRGIKLVLTGRARLTHRLGWRGPTSMMYLTRRFSFHARAFELASACRRAGTAITARLPIAGRLRGRRRVARASEVAVPAAAIPRDPPPERERHCPRVAMLVRDFHDGGLEKVVFDVTKQFLKQGIVCPILVAGSAGRAAKQAEELGCSVQAFGGDVAELVSAVRENGIEVVITHHCYEPLELLSMADVKLIEVIHNAYCWQRDLSFFSELRGRCVDRFVAVSDFVRDYALTALSVPADRIRVIENGLSRYGLIRPDLRQLSQRRATTVNRPLLVHLANAHPQKNHVAVLRAFERVLADHAGASLVLAGVIDDTTDTGRHVQAEIESRRLHDRVRCVGPLGRRELSRLLADAHIGLLPSVVEGFSIASLEYAYFGLPTVLSDTGAARRLTERYGHAVIADTAALSTEQLESAGIERRALEPDSSTVSGIAAAAGTILENYAQFADMARRAGRDWESYSIEVVAREYRNLLTEAVT